MNTNNPELDLGEFATWLKNQRTPPPPTPERQPSETLMHAARRVWEQQQWERAEAGRVFRPLRLAAADGDNEQAPLEMKVRISYLNQGTVLTFEGLIEFMRVGQGEHWRVLCRIDAGEVQALTGHRLRMHIGAETLQLGHFNSRGVARLDLPVGLQPGDLLGLELVPNESS